MLIYVTCLLSFAPASTLPWLVNHFAPGQIMAESSSGTLWHGEMRGIVLAAKGKQMLTLGQGNWSLNPFWLLTGKLPFDFRLSGGSAWGNGHIVFGSNSLKLQQLDFSFPAALLAYANSELNIGSLEEVMNIRSNDLLLQENHYQGHAEVTWERAATSLSKIKPLGNYSLAATGAGKALQLQLQTRSGPLTLAGSGSWSSAAGLQFKGNANPHEKPELKDLLELFGISGANGVYAITVP